MVGCGVEVDIRGLIGMIVIDLLMVAGSSELAWKYTYCTAQ